MEPIEIIRNTMQNQGRNVGVAIQSMSELIDQNGQNSRLLQKARQGKRFLSRWRAWEQHHRITDEDFLLILRDTILMLGKFEGTFNVNNLVGKKGEEFGLYEETTREISADIPQEIFVRQCYGLEDSRTVERPDTAGDRILAGETGFTSYRSFEQKTAVHSALNMPEGYTLLVTLPTGEGKSMVTQLSAARNDGLTVLVVPTTALGKDQARAARSVLKNIPDHAIFDFCGDQTAKLSEVKARTEKREIRLLITSPEALIKNTGLRELITESAENQYLSRLVIDECHIIQEWGAAFRPDFQFLSVVRRQWLQLSKGKLRTILLSATLAEESVASLKELFSDSVGGQDCWIPIRCDALRTEIRYMTDIINAGPELQKEREKKVLKHVKELPKPMLIYMIKPEEAKRWKKLLDQHNIRNTAVFTGLTKDAERSEIIRKWSEDELDIVIATSAFGMGIDKPDVRTVMHVEMPESINRFYQEVGRGGRDGWPSLSMLCCCPFTEFHQAAQITHKKIMTWERMCERWFEMQKNSIPDADIIELNTRAAPAYFNEQERARSGNRNRDWNLHTILFMVRQGWIDFVDMRYVSEQDEYIVKVRMKDPVLLQDREKMKNLGEEPRRKEYEASDRELKVFQQMIREQDRYCFAESFIRIYSKAEMDCGGCPQHKTERYQSSGYHFHNIIPPYLHTSPDGLPLRAWRRYPCMVVAQSEAEEPDNELMVAQKLIKAGITTWIQYDSPDIRKQAVYYPGLVLNPEEADALAEHHISLFGKAALFTLGTNYQENQHILELGCRLMEHGIGVAFHMKPDQIYAGQGKPLRDVVMCRTITEQELQ